MAADQLDGLSLLWCEPCYTMRFGHPPPPARGEDAETCLWSPLRQATNSTPCILQLIIRCRLCSPRVQAQLYYATRVPEVSQIIRSSDSITRELCVAYK